MLEVLTVGLEVPPLDVRCFAVPQHAPIIEASACVGQALHA